MPKFKSPINITERQYNLRYTAPEQERMLAELRVAYKDGRLLPNTVTLDILAKISDRLKRNIEVSEKQADELVRLYNTI